MTIKKHSFWWSNSPPDFSFQPQLPSHADIIITGAGMAGISTAYWLARHAKYHKKTYRIIIIDEAPYAGFRATGRMLGNIYLGTNSLVTHIVDQLGAKIAKKLYEYSSQNNMLLQQLVEKGIQCDAEFNGGLRMASTAKEIAALDQSMNWLKQWGFHPVRFDHQQSQHLAIAPNTKGSLFIPNEGMFDPFAFINELARILRRHGIWIVYGTRIKSADNSPKYGPQIYLENGHTLTATKIIHTTTKTMPNDHLKQTIVYRREHVIKTEPLSKELDDMPLPLMPIELCNSPGSIRIYEGAVMMTGGKLKLKRDPELHITHDTALNERVLERLDATMMRNFPVSNHMDTSHIWTYIKTETNDGLPLIGEIPDLPGHYVSVAYGNNKFGLAFLGAKNLAEKIFRVKVQNSKELSIFSPKRFS